MPNDSDYEQACREYEKGNYLVAYEKFYALAVEHDVSCQMNVANMLLHGIGTAQNREKAYEWYKQAAYNDDPQAQYLYAWHCIENKNEEEGLKYLTLSSEAGYGDAIYDMAGCYYHGAYTCEKDGDKALSLYELAALKGNIDALRELVNVKAQKDGKITTYLYLLKNIFKFAKSFKPGK